MSLNKGALSRWRPVAVTARQERPTLEEDQGTDDRGLRNLTRTRTKLLPQSKGETQWVTDLSKRSSAMSVLQSKKAAQFRALHERDGAFVIVNPWDAGSARILEGLGFEALATTSGGFAWSLGKIDGEVTQSEKLAHCRALADVTSLPISADLGKGFGDRPEEVAATVRLAAATGLVGCSIEDASGVMDGEPYPFDLAVERVTAAVEAVKSLPHDFVLTARCENFATGGTDLDDTIRRLQAFEAVGADVLFAPGIRDLEMIRTLVQSVSKPVNVLTGFSGMTISNADLAEAGVKRISVGTQLARIAYGALVRAAEELKATGAVKDHDIPTRSSEIAKHFT